MTIRTPRGNYKIKEVFGTREDARAKGYTHYFDTPFYEIFGKYDSEGFPLFAAVERIR